MILENWKIIAGILFYALEEPFISQFFGEGMVTYKPVIDGINGKVTCGSMISVSKLCTNLILNVRSITNCSLECFSRRDDCRSFNVRSEAASTTCELFVGRCRILLLRNADGCCSYYHDINKYPKEFWEQNVLHPTELGKTGWNEILIQYQSRAGQSMQNPFNRSWEAFREGFSCLSGCYWLGNGVVYELTQFGKCRLLVVLAPMNANKVYYLYYDPFQIGSDGEGFKLVSMNFSSGNTNLSTNIFTGRIGVNFSTFDRDLDLDPKENCALLFKSGWWFGPSNTPKCGFMNLNAVGSDFAYYSVGGVTLSSSEMWLQCPPVTTDGGNMIIFE